jgi:hypothetical protein
VGELAAAERGVGRLEDHAAAQHHHVPVVLEGRVRLEHGELGVVLGVDALVAEDAAQLEDPVHAPHQQALEVQLAGDPQVQVGVERVVVGDERARQRPARHRQQDRRLDLDVAAGLHRLAQAAHGRRTHPRGRAGLRVDDQVQLALARADLDVGEPLPLVRQRPQRLGEQLDPFGLDRQLAAPGPHHLASDADPVAGIQVERQLEGRLTQGLYGQHHLQLVVALPQRPEGQLAHGPLEEDPAGDAHRVARLLAGRQVLPALGDLGERVRAGEAHREGVDPGGAQPCHLLPPRLLDGGTVLWVRHDAPRGQWLQAAMLLGRAGQVHPGFGPPGAQRGRARMRVTMEMAARAAPKISPPAPMPKAVL